MTSLSSGSHNALVPAAGNVLMLLFRLRCPPPHEQVQSFHSLQSPHMHSPPGHTGRSEHGFTSRVSMLQPCPPSFAGLRMSLVRSVFPVPHELLHLLHAPQSLIWQFIVPFMQGILLHPRTSPSRIGQGFPPFSTSVVTSRLRNCCPPPQLLSHLSQWVQSVTSQSMGGMWHVRISAKCP